MFKAGCNMGPAGACVAASVSQGGPPRVEVVRGVQGRRRSAAELLDLVRFVPSCVRFTESIRILPGGHDAERNHQNDA